ncbi:transposase [Ancylostoma ceylanicum]|uniref:Transposase n=1 Tax=Ancylostoma ceylanicum TaxID=53326 RepID=A0A0D6LHM6_9BILA|nr:transposase [Ancylostoma ceylanicum]
MSDWLPCNVSTPSLRFIGTAAFTQTSEHREAEGERTLPTGLQQPRFVTQHLGTRMQRKAPRGTPAHDVVTPCAPSTSDRRRIQAGIRQYCMGTERLAPKPNLVVMDKKNPGGRPQKLRRVDESHIGRLASNSKISANQVRTELSLNVSKSTIIRAIHRRNLMWQKMKPAPRLAEEHRSARLDFAKNNII